MGEAIAYIGPRLDEVICFVKFNRKELERSIISVPISEGQSLRRTVIGLLNAELDGHIGPKKPWASMFSKCTLIVKPEQKTIFCTFWSSYNWKRHAIGENFA